MVWSHLRIASIIVVCSGLLFDAAAAKPVPAFGQEVVRPGSESAPTLTFAADGVPKRLTIKRGTKVTLTGNLPTSALSATVQLRQGSRVLAQEHVSSDWKLVWDSAQYPGGSCALSVILVDARGQDIRLGSTFITLFDSPPVALVRPLRDTSTIDKLVLHAAVEQDDLDVEKYEVFVEDEDAHIRLDGKGFGSISLAGKIPGIHTIKVRVLLGYGAGELFTESVPIQLRALAQILVPDGGAKVDLRTSNKDTAFPLSVSIDPAVHAKSVGYIIDDQPVGFSEKSPAFDGVAIDASHLYAGAYNLACIVTADDGTRYRSSNSAFTVLRDAKGELNSYLAALQKEIPLLTALPDATVQREAGYLDVLDRLNKGPLDIRAEATDNCNYLIAAYKGMDRRVLDGLLRVPIPLGVPRELHPKIRKGIEQYASSFTCRQNGWLAEAHRIYLMDWVGNHWVFSTDRIVPIASSGSLGGTSGVNKSLIDWYKEAEANRRSSLSVLTHLTDGL